MGTYSLADSITGQAILEGDEVVAMLIANADSTGSISYLFARPHERYKLASLPVRGLWNGSMIEAHDDSSLAVESAVYAANSEAESFESLQEELYTSSKKEIPSGLAKSEFFKNTPPSDITFSMFVTKQSSIDLIVNNAEFSSRLNTTLESERAKVDLLLPLLLENGRKRNSDDKEESADAFMMIDQLTKTIFFETGDYTIPDFENPITARALSSNDESPFSSRLGYFLKERHLYRSDAFRKTQELQALPDGYDEAFSGLYEAQVLSLGMKFLSMPLMPTSGRHTPRKDSSRIEILRHLLKTEVERYIDQVTDDHDSDAVKALDDVLGPIRRDVSDLVKARNSFELKVEQFEAKYRR